MTDDVANELLRPLQLAQGLLEVDDVDAAALGEDVAPHLRVPATRLVPEMDTGLQQFLETYRHRASPLQLARSTAC